MLVSCSKCGGLHPRGYKCGKRTYRKTEKDKSRSLYKWTKKSLEVRENVNGLCEMCLEEGRYTYKGLEVHHIEKIRENEDGLLDDYNLICLCVEHHKKADAGEIDKEVLKGIVRRRLDGS